MRSLGLALCLGASLLAAPATNARERAPRDGKPWCAPEVTTLGERLCFAEGGTPASGRRTLVIYLHGALAATPGFAWLQQRAMALHARRLKFTVLLPTAPPSAAGFVWPGSRSAPANAEAEIVAGLRDAQDALERRVGHRFDEVFVVGFSSGAYYASSLAVRSALDVDGYAVFAGGSGAFGAAARAQRDRARAPVFVGVSARDTQTAGHSRAFASSLAALGWPHRVEERDAGHMVDWALLEHGIAWLRARRAPDEVTSAGTPSAP